MAKNLKLVIGVLASIVPLITSIISTIITHVELNKVFKSDQYDYWYTYNDELISLSFYFTSSYVTFILFIGFLVVVILAAFNILKNYLLIIILTCFDGAVMVTVGGGLYMSMFASQYTEAGVGMFVGAALLLLVKIFPTLPLTIELLTKGISLWNTRNDSMLRKYLPFAIYGALMFGFLASLVYTGAALAVTIKCYAQTYNHGGCFYSPAILFYSLPLFIFLQMIVAMVLFVHFKWKWGVLTFAFFSSFLLVTLGIALNFMAIQLYYYNKYNHYYGERNDFHKVLHKANIFMTLTSVFMIVITIFVNMAWPVLYNLRNPTGNEETNSTLPVPYNLHNPTANEETNMAWPVLYNPHNPTGNEETNSTLPVPYNLHNPTTNEDTKQLLN